MIETSANGRGTRQSLVYSKILFVISAVLSLAIIMQVERSLSATTLHHGWETRLFIALPVFMEVVTGVELWRYDRSGKIEKKIVVDMLRGTCVLLIITALAIAELSHS